jgi:ABC-2 type transport system permease protein
MREAETLRFSFVQALNNVHVEQLSYTDDINRNVDANATKKARVSAQNWQILQNFNFTIDDASTRLNRSFSAFLQVLLWIAALTVLIRLVGRRAL